MTKKLRKIIEKKLKGSILGSFFISYIILGVVLLLISAPISYIMGHKASERTAQANYYILAEFRSTMDKHLENMEIVLHNVALSPEIKSVSLPPILTNANYYELSTFIPILDQNRMRYEPLADCIGLYSSSSAKVVSNLGTYETEKFLDRICGAEENSRQSWLNGMNSSNSYFLVDTISGQKMFYKLIGGKTMPFPKEYTLFISFDTAIIREKIQIISESTGNDIIFYNSGHNVYIASPAYDTTSGMPKEFEKAPMSCQSKVDSIWNYALLPNNSFYSNHFKQIPLITNLSLLIQLVIATLLAIYFSRKQYKPFRFLVENLSSDNSPEPISDEYNFIKSRFNALVHEQNNFNSSVGYKALHNLLYNHYTEEDLKVFYRYYNNTSHKYYSVILISPNEDDLLELTAEEYSHSDIYTIFQNIIAEILQPYYISTFFTIGDYFGCLISSENDDGENTSQLLDSARQVIYRYFKLRFYTAISQFETNPANLHNSFSKASEAVTLLKTLDTEPLILCDELQTRLQTTYYDLETKNKILNLIHSNQPEKAYEIFEDMADKVSNTAPANYIQEQLMFHVISMFTYILADIVSGDDIALYNKYNPTVSLLPCNTIADLKQNALRYIFLLCEYLHHGSESATQEEPLEKQIIDYINDTFCDPDCNAAIVCKKFNISAPVLSQLFKKNFDIGFLDYITSLRIDRSKYYLESSEKNMDDISVLVGYTTTRSFFRAFKRIEGITPGQYRKNFTK